MLAASRRHRFAAVGGLTLLLIMAGCTAGQGNAPGGPRHSNAPSASAKATPGAPSSSSSAKPPPARKTPVAAPHGGSIKKKISPHKQVTAKPVGLDKTSRIGSGVTVTLGAITSLDAKAIGPGEISGPSIAVDVKIKNASSKPIDLDSSVVNVLQSDGAPAIPLTSDPYHPLAGTLGSGKSRTGVYVFNIAKKSRHSISILVSYSPTAKTAHFKGTVR